MENQKRGLNPLEVMGIFWMAFGVVVMIAVYAPPTWMGKLVNLLSGLTLFVIGIIAFFKGGGGKLSKKE
jgi:hypothetical protein